MSPIRMVLDVLVLGLIFLPGPVSSQDVTCPEPEHGSGSAAVVGRVVDAETGVRLGFAIVRVLVTGRQAPFEGRANRSGEFHFCSVPLGRISVSAQLGELGAVVGPVDLEEGQVFHTELRLEPATEARFSGTVTGVVLEVGTSEPIDGAAVTLLDLGQYTVTNEFGRFVFPSLPPGITTVQVKRLGYAEMIEEIEVQIGRVVDTRIVLSTEPIALPPTEIVAVRRRIELPGLEDSNAVITAAGENSSLRRKFKIGHRICWPRCWSMFRG